MEIKIAPSREEITRTDNVFTCEFYNMSIKWVIDWDCSELSEKDETLLKDWLSNAIAFSSKLWQVPFILNENLPFKSDIFVDDELIENPCSK